VKPFEYVLTLMSFVYSLGLTHLLYGASRMIRYRRKLRFSLAHVLWMLVGFGALVSNWISQWDFHTQATFDLATIASGMVVCVATYMVCALVVPDFEVADDFDLVGFHQREGRSYMTAVLVLVVIALVANFAAGAALGITNWSNGNLLVMAQGALVILGLVRRDRATQVFVPAALILSFCVFNVMFYSKLT
jgi:hypothetical protein